MAFRVHGRCLAARVPGPGRRRMAQAGRQAGLAFATPQAAPEQVRRGSRTAAPDGRLAARLVSVLRAGLRGAAALCAKQLAPASRLFAQAGLIRAAGRLYPW